MAEAQMERVVALLSPDRRWKEAERFLTTEEFASNRRAVLDNPFHSLRGMGRILGERFTTSFAATEA